ncbi:MFS transporter [Euryarchaeota archaeon ex4484_178]|nr:MAG: MFS transporter [Euryarchaeota archaeon ex4484_178]
MGYWRSLLEDFRLVLSGNIGVLFLTWILLNFGHGMVNRFNGVYFSALGASDIILGFMGSLTFGMMALLQIPGGYLADVFGRRRVIVIFTTLMAFSMLIFAFAPSWEYIVIGLIISNVALLYQPALFSIMIDSLPATRRAEGYAITNLSMLPGVIAPTIGGALILYYGTVGGMRIGYFVLFILSLVSAILRLRLRETVRIEKHNRPGFFESFKIIGELSNRAKGLILTNMLISGAGGMVGYFVVKYAYTYTTSVLYGIAMGLITLLLVFLSIPFGRKADAGRKEKYYVFGVLLLSASLAIFTIPSVFALFSYSVLTGMGMALMQPATQGLIGDYVSGEHRGRYTGVYLFLSYLSAMFLSGVAGYIYKINPNLLFLFSSSIYALAAILAFFILFKQNDLEN